MFTQSEYALDRLRQALAGCAGGSGRLALVTGGLATGKTELLRAFAGQAAQRGALVLTATGSRAEHTLRGGLLDQLMRDSRLPSRARLAAVELTSTSDGSDELGTTAAAALHELGATLVELSRRQPIVVNVDDIQFADALSLHVLSYLRRRISSARVLMVLAQWARSRPCAALVHAEVTRRPELRIVLQRLTETQVPAEHYRLSGGNPLLVAALAEDPTGGAAYRRAVLDCLQRWEPHLMDVAHGLAIMGRHATPELIGRLTGLGAEEAEEAIDILTVAGLVHDGRLRHPLIAATVADKLKSAADVRLRAAELLYEQGADWMDIARLLVAAGTAPDRWAVDVLRHAAEEALREDDTDLAARSLAVTLAACGDERDRAPDQAALARVEWRDNPAVAARHLTSLREALRAGGLPARDAATVITQSLWHGHLDGIVELINQVRKRSGPGDAQAIAEIELAYEGSYGRLDGRPPTADNAWARAATLNDVWTYGVDTGTAAGAELILERRLGETDIHAVANALLVLEYAGSPDQAVKWCDQLLHEAATRGGTTWLAVLTGVRADMALRRGDVTGARERADAALGLLPKQSWGVLLGLPLSVLVRAATVQNDLEVPREVLGRVVPESMYRSVFGMRYLYARGLYHHARGRNIAALGDLEQCGAVLTGLGRDVPGLVPWRTGLASVQLSLGRPAAARTLLEHQLAHPGPVDSTRVRGATLRLLAAVSPADERPAILRQAAELSHESGDRLELAVALSEASVAFREVGAMREARSLARRAAREAKACGINGSAASSAGDADQAEDESGGVTTLSTAERRVATLAALGHSNRDIGRRLFVTVSTVEQHLTRVYRKLKVRSRNDLPAELAQVT
ncbi:helix-turn-helix transcriptional regulator [Saccharothrix sp. NRRL B-16314]|uniref:helix-turn-helix transcriptional regulator n=1 Tax=Saccharothrix sp. NRRL B-16314 TaxID=1463825 RepID=UPI000526C142|nr:LuxR family transcriptional regulator [Saccharothrix sp. NRRL B-16314]